MGNQAKPIRIHSFDPDSPLHQLPRTRQARYLLRYLSDLKANSVIEEPNYFDRDYLSEFSAFYSRSSTGYPNVCRRLHFFSSPGITRAHLKSAASGSKQAHTKLQSTYLGFVVLRPIPAAPFGRTVLRWYDDLEPATPRITTPSRKYFVHIAGIRLEVDGLAWQQQDSGVGACATVGLWSMLHSSAFDDHHAIPTTTQITEAAHRTASLGSRVYPSNGLRDFQICEAIKEHSLAPLVCNCDLPATEDTLEGFSPERFSSLCAAFLRSGYPVLIGGHFIGIDGQHAICAVGFRSCAPTLIPQGDYGLQDAAIPRLYVHDDNIGPSVRFDIINHGPRKPVTLRATTPPYSGQPGEPHPVNGYYDIQPTLLLVATHEDIRTSPDKLHFAAEENAQKISILLDHLFKKENVTGIGVTTSARYMKLSEYMAQELDEKFHNRPRVLSKVRLALAEKAPPMSLHLGIIRIGLHDATLLVDILYDTTDSETNHPAFAHVYYQPAMKALMEEIAAQHDVDFGVPIAGC